MEVKIIGFSQFGYDGFVSSNDVIYSAMSQCYNPSFDIEKVSDKDTNIKEELIEKVLGMGHKSVAEHISYTFLITGVSRALTHQLVRHRIASYTQQSQRYTKTDVDSDWYVVPDSIAKNTSLVKAYADHMRRVGVFYDALIDNGIPKEDARFILPNACKSNIVVTMNARALSDFFGKRLCNRAQWEIREMAGKMADACKAENPLLFDNLAWGEPQCFQLGYCPEGKMCCHNMPYEPLQRQDA